MSSTTTKTVRTRTTNKSSNPKTQRNRNRRKRQNERRKQVRNLASLESSQMIHKCTKEYASALVNPFGTRNTLPCIPDVMTLPSMKFQSKCRGVFSTGTQGCGFVTLNPWLMAINNGGFSTSNHSFPVTYTTPAFEGDEYTDEVVASALPTGVSTAESNVMFDNTWWGEAHRQIRLVAAGLRITYIGSDFRNQGRVILFKSQGNISPDNGSSASDLLNDNYTALCPISRKSEYVFYSPDSSQLQSYNDWNTFDPNESSVLRRSIVIFIDGGDTESPQSWLFEAVAYFESVGPNMTLSKSHSDPNGFGDVLESLPIKNPTVPPKQVEASIIGRLLALAGKSAQMYGPRLLKYGTRAALNTAFGSLNVGDALLQLEDS